VQVPFALQRRIQTTVPMPANVMVTDPSRCAAVAPEANRPTRRAAGVVPLHTIERS
jgi:hypothetical protein